ncbi:MAG TPA: FAD:protein FMN transferase [Acidobacteriota bacterium]|jgi:thiamine biosynthesis lipoprotein
MRFTKYPAIILFLICATAFAIPLWTSCALPARPLRAANRSDLIKRYEFSEPHMGTLFRIVIYSQDPSAAAVSARAAFQRIAELDRMLSDYRYDSELMILSRRAGSGKVVVSDDLFSVLEQAQMWARKTNGAFDVTVGPAVRLWRRARQTGELPAPEDLARARSLIGYQNIELEHSKRMVSLLKPGMQLDLGGIAKGYAADQALKTVKSRGHSSVLIAAGGDIAVADAPPGLKGWTVAVAAADQPGSNPTRRILLANAAVSTSGDAEQFIEIGGERYSHIVDPHTGIGVTGQSTATVVASDATTSDALATGLSVLGPAALPLLDSLERIAALLVRKGDDGFQVYASSRWKETTLSP